MKKLPVIAEESFVTVMDELSKEIDKVMTKIPYDAQWIAFEVFYGTLTNLLLTMFEGCPEEDVKDIMAAFQTWMDVGLLMGKSPKLLKSILDRTAPTIREFIVPEWMEAEEWKEEVMGEAEEIIKKASGHQNGSGQDIATESSA